MDFNMKLLLCTTNCYQCLQYADNWLGIRCGSWPPCVGKQL